MSISDETDHARGWLFAEGLLLEDRIARQEKMSENELDEELRANGIDPERVPSVEALLARATALAEEKEKERGTVDHARGWNYVENLPSEEDAGKDAEPDGVPTLEHLLAKAGALAEQEAAGNGVAQAVAAEAPENAPPRSTMTPRRLRTAWFVAAAPAVLLTVFAVMNGGAIVAIVRGQEIKPDDTWLPWKPPPTPQERAAPVRAYAFASCRDQHWSECEAKLNEARDIDPEGESAAQVVEARAAIEASKTAPDPKDKPQPRLKPPP